jgi:hypothetical protein
VILVDWDRDAGSMQLEEDTAFNCGKGQLKIVALKPDGKTPGIHVVDINPNALLRVKVHTDYRRPIMRGDFASLPFHIQTPRAE